MQPSENAPRAFGGPRSRESRSPLPSVPSPSTAVQEDPIERLLEEVIVEPEASPLLASRSLRGRCAIVTGGADGVGRAIALEFARQGVHVGFTYFDHTGNGRAAEEAERTRREIMQLEVRAHCEECDVRDLQAVQGFVDRSLEILGGLHILVNNADVTRDRALWRLTDDQWGTVIDTRLTGAFHLIRAIAPHFRAQGDGKIVNVASVHALRSEFGLANSSAANAGLLALTRSAALELGPSNINVNAVAPGFIRSAGPMDDGPEEVIDKAREKPVLGRLGTPEDVANVVAFLCSDLARHVTGAVVPIDGGHVL